MTQKKFELLSDPAILAEMGKRFEAYRQASRLPDQEIFRQGGVTKDALAKFKKGKNISLINWIKILRGANLLHSLETLFSVPIEFSPLAILEEKKTKKIPKRIHALKTKKAPFQWGDE